MCCLTDSDPCCVDTVQICPGVQWVSRGECAMVLARVCEPERVLQSGALTLESMHTMHVPGNFNEAPIGMLTAILKLPHDRA